MAHEIIVTIPQTGDVLRFPPFDDADSYKRRIQNLRYQTQTNPVGLGPAQIPAIINTLDNAQDLLSVGLTLTLPIFRHLGPEARAVWGGFYDIAQSLNAINQILGAIQAGRAPKRKALDFLSSQAPGHPAQVANRGLLHNLVDPILLGGFNPIGFILEAGQVLYNITGYGLCLGNVMQLVSSPLWIGLDLLAGRHLTIITGPPNEPLFKAREFLAEQAIIGPSYALLEPNDQLLVDLASIVGITLLSTAPVVPQYDPTPEEIGMTVYHYDRFREIVQNDFIQIATPFVEYTSNLDDQTVYDPLDPRTERLGLPVKWPWNPIASEQLTLDPRNYLPDEWLERHSDRPAAIPGHTNSQVDPSWVKYWDERQATYIEWDKQFGPYAFAADEARNQLALKSAAANAVAYEIKHSVYDYATWYNNNEPLFRMIPLGTERLMAIAIEENIFPPVPRSEFLYSHCSEPYDPPTRLGIVADAPLILGIWFERARELWNNPGTPYLTYQEKQGGGVEWIRKPFPGRTYRAGALIAASYELWGARYYKTEAESPLVPYWANWLMEFKPSGIYYEEPGTGAVTGDGTLRAKLRFKRAPSNDWSDCLVKTPVPPGPCTYIVLPDGTFIVRCPTPPLPP